MGLDTTHGAFHGAYSAYFRWRGAILQAIGGRGYGFNDDAEPKRWYFPEGMTSGTNPGLFELLSHPDSDGDISPENCKLIADELEAIIPLIALIDNGGEGHILRDHGYVAVTQRFINGCRRAHEAGERLEYH